MTSLAFVYDLFVSSCTDVRPPVPFQMGFPTGSSKPYITICHLQGQNPTNAETSCFTNHAPNITAIRTGSDQFSTIYLCPKESDQTNPKEETNGHENLLYTPLYYNTIEVPSHT